VATSPFALVYGWRLCFTNDVCSATPKRRGTRGADSCMAGWHWQKFWSRFVFTV